MFTIRAIAYNTIMGRMEADSKSRARRAQFQRVALTALATVGAVGIALAAPNTLRLLGKLDATWLTGNDPKRRLRNVAYSLKKKGLIEWVSENGRVRMRITPRGKKTLEKVTYTGKPLPTPRRWDGKWRLVIFDIRESRRGTRNKVRAIVKGFGFVRLQHSIWAYPYDCEEIITLLKQDLSLGRELLYIIADAIEYDTPLRRHFKL